MIALWEVARVMVSSLLDATRILRPKSLKRGRRAIMTMLIISSPVVLPDKNMIVRRAEIFDPPPGASLPNQRTAPLAARAQSLPLKFQIFLGRTRSERRRRSLRYLFQESGLWF